MKDLKKHTSVDEQIEILKSRGLIIQNKEFAKTVLSNINYYRFTGYLHNFKNPTTGLYPCGLTFERIKRIYDFDRRLTRILMFALEDVEETFKTRLSYIITSDFPDDPLIYLKPTIYRSYNQYIQFLNLFYNEVDRNANLPFVKHHRQNYNGMLPMWVAVELFTMGNLTAVYENLYTKYQKAISKTYWTGPTQLKNWICNLTYTRNHLAHYMRVYNYNFGRTPAKCRNHSADVPVTNMIFDQIRVISYMYSDPHEWNTFVIPGIGQIIEEYSESIQLPAIGFPGNWENVLRREEPV